MKNPILRAVIWALPFLLSVGGGAHAQISALPTTVVTDCNDVMNGARPKMPSFPALAPKRGLLRGFAKSTSGKPLANARILIASPAIWGSSASVSARTDARGYYEMRVPSGGCTVRFAGYGVTYGGKPYGLPLHPTDGQLDSIPVTGGIENFVLLTYGPVSAAKAANDPVQTSAYYGGSFAISYWLRDPENTMAPASNFPEGSEVEITLTPQGPLLGGERGRVFVIRCKLQGSYFQVNDIPIGLYKIKAVLTSQRDRPLRLTEQSGAMMGLTPATPTRDATLLLRPWDSEESTIVALSGGMVRHSLSLSAE